MTYKVVLHPSVRRNLKKLYLFDGEGYDYVKQRLHLLAYILKWAFLLRLSFRENGEFI